MSARLRRGQVARHIAKLRDRSALTALQAVRLDAIVEVLGDDGRFRLRDALVVAEFPEDDARGQDAFQDFRKRVNQAAATAGVELALELDTRKTAPDTRYGWFSGGDLVDEGIASFTGATAARLGGEHPVAPEVAELDKSRRTRVYVSHHVREGRERRLEDLLRRLREHLGLDPDAAWEVVGTTTAGLGEDVEATRDRLCAQADVRMVLVEPAYLVGNERERGRALAEPDRVVAVALRGLPGGPLRLGPLSIHDIICRDRPWDELTRSDQRRGFIEAVTDAIRRALRHRSETDEARERSPDEALSQWTGRVVRAKRPYDSECQIEGDVAETSLRESDPGQDGPAAMSRPLPAIERLAEWSRGGTQRLCTLLGDVGMGKTTTVKLFAQRLLDLRKAGEAVPLPILFDLREVRVTGLAEQLTLERILTSMLEASHPPSVAADRLTAGAVLDRIAQGNTVVVFDGLDEVLVHLSPHDQQLFTRQLWRAVDERSGSRLLVTCRTQYFRTIREETSFFTGGEREGPRGEHYLALMMLPFDEQHIRKYLLANVGRDEAWVDGFLDTIAGVHNLPDLARRPITLRFIADQVEFIETAKLHGRTVRSVDLYREFVDRWLSRDGGKHTLTPEHKRLLMEQLAAGLWRSGRNSWEPADVEDWLLELLERRPDLRRHYREHVPDLWKADFRTATFLSRDGNTFSFAHRSLLEYFLAAYLCRALTGDRVFESWAMPVPSPETLDFLGQSIAGLRPDRHCVALAALARTATRYVPQTSELAFAYAVHAARHGYPSQSLADVQLQGACLEDLSIGTTSTYGGDRPLLPMARANLSGARLRRTVFTRVDLTGADLTGADLTTTELHSSRLASSRLAGASAVGSILRDCDITGADLDQARAYQAQLLRSTPPADPAGAWLVAPRSSASPPGSQRLRVLTGHSGVVWSVAWSSDCTQLASGGTDGAVRIWDAQSGALLHELAGHHRGVRSVAWSPDDAQLASVGGDGAVRIWDGQTGALLHELGGHHRGVRSVAWSPNGAQLASGGEDGAVRLWDAKTGATLHTLTGHHAWVWSVAWSPDGRRLASGGDDAAVRLWDAKTGAAVNELTGHAWVRSVAWSPSGAQLASGGTDGAVRRWDGQTGALLHELAGHHRGVRSVAWSPNGAQLASGGNDGAVRLWDAKTGATLHKLTGHHAWVGSVAWSPDGAQLASGGNDGAVRLWDAKTGAVHLELPGYHDWLGSVAWSPDGTRLASSGDDRAVRLWDAKTGATLLELTGHHDWVWSVAWSADGTQLASSGGDGAVRVWDAQTGATLHELTGHHARVRSVAWSPDGTRLASSGDDGAVRLWDAKTGATLLELTGHHDWVRSVAWSPNGTQLASSGDDRAVRVWDAATGKPTGYEYVTLPGGELAVFDAASRALVGASDGAWRWLGWTVVQDGRLTRLPAETFGLLPPLPQPDARHERETPKLRELT